jgi:hypothetical protein
MKTSIASWHGQGNHQAILDGAQQIAVPAPFSTLCICIVFIPMFFSPARQVPVHSFGGSRGLRDASFLYVVADNRSNSGDVSLEFGRRISRRIISGKRWAFSLSTGFERNFEGSVKRLPRGAARRSPLAFDFLRAPGLCIFILLVGVLGRDFFQRWMANRLHMRARTDCVLRGFAARRPGEYRHSGNDSAELTTILDNIGSLQRHQPDLQQRARLEPRRLEIREENASLQALHQRTALPRRFLGAVLFLRRIS